MTDDRAAAVSLAVAVGMLLIGVLAADGSAEAPASAGASPTVAQATTAVPGSREARWRTETLTAYLDAWKAGDCAASHVWVSKGFGPATGEMCGRVALLDYLIGQETVARPDGRVSTVVTLSTDGAALSDDQPHDRWFVQRRRPGGHWVIDEVGTVP